MAMAETRVVVIRRGGWQKKLPTNYFLPPTLARPSSEVWCGDIDYLLKNNYTIRSFLEWSTRRMDQHPTVSLPCRVHCIWWSSVKMHRKGLSELRAPF